MIIITDAASAGSLFDKYIVRQPLEITVISEDGDLFQPEAVKMLLNAKAQITAVPAGASKAFAFGLAIGEWDKPKDVYVVTTDKEISKTAELMGFQTQLQKKEPGAKTKTRAPRAKNSVETKQSNAAKQEIATTETKTARTKTVISAKSETPKARKSKTEKEAATDTKRQPPQRETVYKDNSDAAGSKPSAAFTKAIVKAGVDKADAQGVWNAIVKSSAAIVYDMQLRLCLLDADKAKDIYEKTRGIFDNLKKLTASTANV